ncbi:hypothetical protein LCL96_02725 [Rossellomorea aquimaris]|uniref:hypothetical protein n=1 Tax=Rossellomorea TaxID=2837508 RepID=UPI001CD7FECA|nr:hypothetical protein [Rossellomorea aquimaris]MCA1057828.1 hypothetical protein [Rossellomorea aquimaris]
MLLESHILLLQTERLFGLFISSADTSEQAELIGAEGARLLREIPKSGAGQV